MSHLEVRGEIGSLLCDQLDVFQDLIDQRDRARSIAVALEQECAHLEQERDAALHDAAQWQSAVGGLVEQRDRLREQVGEQ